MVFIIEVLRMLFLVIRSLKGAGNLHVESTSGLLLMTPQVWILRFARGIRVRSEHVFAFVHDSIILHILDHAAIRQSDKASVNSRCRLLL